MNTSEQITALLHGELTDDRSVAELMHRLSVSPEKRATFLEHVKTSRQLLRSGRGIAPTPSATQGVWSKIAALEPGLGGAVPLAESSDSRPDTERSTDWRKWSLFLLLLLVGLGGGYVLGSRTATVDMATPSAVALKSTPSDPIPAASIASGERGSVGDKKSREAITVMQETGSPSAAKENRLHARIAELKGLLENEQQKNVVLRTELDAMRSAALEEKRIVSEMPENQAFLSSSLRRPLERSSTRGLPLATPAEAKEASLRPATAPTVSDVLLRRPAASSTEASGPLRIEMRQHLRSSLPGVYGLESPNGIFSDRELGASLEFTAMQRSMRLGVAVGGTTFSQVYHTNTGGALNDTIIEQAPDLLYGRAYIAPRLFSGGRILGSLELGAGATELGPIGTAGLNLEYAIAGRATLHAGVSSWLLWTSFLNQLHTSTNLNAHIGVSLNP